LADAKTEPEVMATVLDILGTQLTSNVGLPGTRRVYKSLKQRNEMIDRIPIGKGVSSAYAKLPRVIINLFDGETPSEQIEQIDNLDRVLKLFKIAGQKVDKDGKVVVEDLRSDFMNRGAKLVAVTDQLKTDLENNKLNFGMTTDQLLDYFQEYNIILDVSDLYNMIQVPPLKQVITNIQGDKVVFKGQSDDSENPNQESEQEKVVAQMAKRAMKS
jgi:hypothetical protein